jgi:eukaryotic-like serine/threonine-protein kinase
MADVYRAEDQLLKRDVAVKVMREVSSSSNDDERFRAEAQTLAGLDHPNLVTVLDAGSSQIGPYLVMELVEGSSLSAYLGQEMDPMRVAAIGRDLADALSYVHRRGIVHRDIKPGNILLDGEGRVRLADFGIARMLSETSRHTATGATIGTAGYLSPEQVRGDEISPAADLYALGLVLLEALTGERVYKGSLMEAALARLHTPPQIPSTLSEGWKEVLLAMTALEPEDRATAFEATQRLGALTRREVDLTTTTPRPSLVTEPVSGPVVSAGQEARSAGSRSRTGRYNGRRLGLVSIGAAVVVLGGFLLLSPGASAGGSDIPANLPSHLRQPLQDLHDAVDG